MAKYRGAHLDQMEAEEQELAMREAEMQQEQVDNTESNDPEEETYRKRYGDLRRHSTQLAQKKEDEINSLRQQLDSAAKGQLRFPKTDEEIDAWSARYPEVAKVVDTIAQKRALESMEGLREGEKRLIALETKLTKKDAENQLLNMHPDFNQIRSDEKFHEWVAMQPQSIQDALYKNNTDALAASRAIDLYKSDTGKKTSKSRSAAESVGRTSSNQPTGNSKSRFSESMIKKMSDLEYAKNEEAIMQSLKNESFVYDITGGAR